MEDSLLLPLVVVVLGCFFLPLFLWNGPPKSRKGFHISLADSGSRKNPRLQNNAHFAVVCPQVTYQLKNLVSNLEARLTRLAVHPSRIHKRGLFALRSFRPDEVICEYTGELIRNIICDRREAEYKATGVDCYMFRVDPDWVIDATYAGNYARFINHSCQVGARPKLLLCSIKTLLCTSPHRLELSFSLGTQLSFVWEIVIALY